MTTFATQIFSCRKCKHRLYYIELTSVFIASSESYSDGYIDASPPVNSFNQIVICPHCQQLEWKDDITIEDEYSLEDSSQCINISDMHRSFETNKNLELARYYLELIDNGFANSTNREVEIRMEIWRTLNNSVRYTATVDSSNGIWKKVWSVFGYGINRKKHSMEERKIFESNLEKLVTLFKPEYYEQELLLAEMYREISKFDKALIVLDRISEADRDPYYNQIESAVRKRNEKVIKLN